MGRCKNNLKKSSAAKEGAHIPSEFECLLHYHLKTWKLRVMYTEVKAG